MENYVDNITDNISNKIHKILDIEYHYDVLKLFDEIKDLSEDEKCRVIGDIINSLLLKIRDIDNIKDKIYEFYGEGKYDKYVEDLISFFATDESEEVQSEGEIVAIDLINKTLGKNRRKLELPIEVDSIKNYCINSCIRDEDTELVLMWVVIKLICMYHIIEKFGK